MVAFSVSNLNCLRILAAGCLLLLATSATAQELKVRTASGPFHVGEAIAIEIDAINFEDEPSVEIQGSKQDSVKITFRNTGRSESTQIFQSGGKLVRNRVVKTTFYYTATFESAGEFKIGPFEATYRGKKITRPAVTFRVRDIDVTQDMRVEIKMPTERIYPGQQVPIQIRWLFAGDPRLVRGLTIRSSFFDRFDFIDSPVNNRANALPLTTSKGVINLPAEFERETIDGKEFLVGTVERTMVADKPEKITLPPIFVSFRKVVGTKRSNDPFDNFFGGQPATVPLKGIGEAISFEIKPFPTANRPATFRGAVGEDFQMDAELNRTNIRTGDPVVLQLNIRGKGNLDAIRLPNLAASFSKQDFDWPDGEVAGVRSNDQKQFRVSIRVKNDKVTEVPPISFSWFDPETESYKTTKTAPISLDVKEGVVVSSDEVISNNTGSNQKPRFDGSDETADLDLSIETDIDRLVRSGNSHTISVWSIYGFGVAVICIVCFVDRSRRKSNTVSDQLQPIRNSCKEVLSIGATEPISVSNLASRLREIQSLVSQTDAASSSDSGFLDKLDELVSRCDVIAFRPQGASQEEQTELVEQAKNLLREF